MPDFTKAEVSSETTDLTAYRAFLKRLEIGQVVVLPLEDGETTRRVMRSLNLAAGSSGMRIARLRSERDVVRFRVLSPTKRPVTMSEEAKRARAEKAKATRATRRKDLEQARAMGMPDGAAGSPADRVIGAASGSEVGGTGATAARPRRRRRASS